MFYKQDLMAGLDVERGNTTRKKRSDTKKRERIKSCVIAVLVIVNLALCSCVLVVCLANFSAVNERLAVAEDRISILQELSSQDGQENQDFTETSEDRNGLFQLFYSKRSKRNAEKSGKKRGNPGSKRHAGSKRQPEMNVLPYIHLLGHKQQITETKHRNSEGKDVEYFSWTTGTDNHGRHGFDLDGDTPGRYQTIKIKQQGVYLVYVQVTIYGRNDYDQHNECSHDTVLRRHNKDTVILKSLVTQHNLSGVAYDKNSMGDPLKPIDSQSHIGVFMLLKDDLVFVQVPPGCGNQIYNNNEHNSYFGLAQLWKLPEKRPVPEDNRVQQKTQKQKTRA